MAEVSRGAAMRAVRREIRIHSTGFRDANRTWFSTWERAFPGRTFSHELAEGPTGPELVAFCGDGVGCGEMLLADFLRFGLPETGTDERAVAYAALFDAIEELAATGLGGETVQRARAALRWYERHLERE